MSSTVQTCFQVVRIFCGYSLQNTNGHLCLPAIQFWYFKPVSLVDPWMTQSRTSLSRMTWCNVFWPSSARVRKTLPTTWAVSCCTRSSPVSWLSAGRASPHPRWGWLCRVCVTTPWSHSRSWCWGTGPAGPAPPCGYSLCTPPHLVPTCLAHSSACHSGYCICSGRRYPWFAY